MLDLFFGLGNSGSSDLIISSWFSDDQQFSAEAPGEYLVGGQIVVAPGESAPIAVTYDPLRVGTSEAAINLVTNDLDPDDRKRFAMKVKDTETDILYTELRAVDVESSKRIHRNDRYRIIRALEIYTLTGTNISTHFARHRETGKNVFPLDFQKIGLKMNRTKLRQLISDRTLQMFDLGWADEVKSILDRGAKPSWPGMQTLGYPEVVRYIKGVDSKDDVIGRINILTGQYAKRQMTWFNKEPDVNWIDLDKQSPFETLIKDIDRQDENC